MSDENDESVMCAKLLEYGGIGEVWNGIEWEKGVELFDPFGVDRFDPLSEEEARELQKLLNPTLPIGTSGMGSMQAKVFNDAKLMYLVYLTLVCAGIEGVAWTCVKREGFITQVRGTCCGASLDVVVYPKKYSFTITATMSSGIVKVYPAVYTFNKLQTVVKEWRGAVARMIQ